MIDGRQHGRGLTTASLLRLRSAFCLGWAASLIALTTLPGCVQPHCTNARYSDAECRVIAENEHARLRASNGAEIRFQLPDAREDDRWEALGLLAEQPDGTIQARVAGPGPFALSVRAPEDADLPDLRIRLRNVDRRAALAVGAAGLELQQPTELDESSNRLLSVSLAAGQTQWIRGTRDCPPRYRLAVTADIQTNPTQFERIVDRLQQEARTSAEGEAPLVGVLIAGDLTESSRDDEFETVDEILARLPVPAAVTPGNHDIYRPNRPHYNRTFGPGNYSVNVCGVHVTMLDSGSGTIARSVQARLPELLHRGDAQFLVVGLHHPPYPGQTGAGWSREDHAAALLAELARERADLVVAGHHHALRQFAEIPVGDVNLREVVVGTGGAYQGVGIPRYGYLRLSFDDDAGTMERCFVEVPPAGYAEPPNEPPGGLPYCD
ncbi:MAG: metallophosphoesterase [Myxococcota bacterium]